MTSSIVCPHPSKLGDARKLTPWNLGGAQNVQFLKTAYFQL
jgi:hypothetical protein